MDDIFGDTPVDANADVYRAHYTHGYREGRTSGAQKDMQLAFDEYYPKGAAIGIKVGQILAKIGDLDQDLLKQAMKELELGTLITANNFTEWEMNENGKAILDKWEKMGQSTGSVSLRAKESGEGV